MLEFILMVNKMEPKESIYKFWLKKLKITLMSTARMSVVNKKNNFLTMTELSSEQDVYFWW